MALLNEIIRFIDNYLMINEIDDYSYNGLQVEGKKEVSKIVTGVTANHELLVRAGAAGADLVLAHHGLYWKKADPRLTGILGKRVKALGEMSLAAYHLPLDVHEKIGNNALIVKAIGAEFEDYIRPGKRDSIGVVATFSEPVAGDELAARIKTFCGNREPMVIGSAGKSVKRIAVCSGGGGFMFEENIQGIDAVISGEIHEQHYHLAVENDVMGIVCGHHASEMCGIRALGELVAEKFGISCEFINVLSPI